MAAKKKTAKKKAPAKKAPTDKTQTVNPKNGALESDCIWDDGVLCDKRTRLPVK